MALSIQIKSLVSSFVFGICFYFIVKSTSKFLYSKKKYVNVISALLVSIISCLLFFIIMKKINNGIIHFYFILSIILGYFISYKLKLWDLIIKIFGMFRR